MIQRSRKGGVPEGRHIERAECRKERYPRYLVCTSRWTYCHVERDPILRSQDPCSIFLGRWIDVPLFPEIARRVAAWVGKTWDHDGSSPRGQPEMMDNPGDRHPLGPIEEYIPTYAMT